MEINKEITEWEKMFKTIIQGGKLVNQHYLCSY